MTKTMGIYKLTSEYDTNFKMVGASTQIEVCTKDYISWVSRKKAPKIMQDSYDNYVAETSSSVTPKEFFKCNILKEVNTPEELASAKIEYGLGSGGIRGRNTNPKSHARNFPNKAVAKNSDWNLGDKIAYRNKVLVIMYISGKNAIVRTDNSKYLSEIPLQHLKKSSLYKKILPDVTESVPEQ